MSRAKHCAKKLSKWAKETSNINPNLRNIFDQFSRSPDGRARSAEETNDLLAEYLTGLDEKIKQHKNSGDPDPIGKAIAMQMKEEESALADQKRQAKLSILHGLKLRQLARSYDYDLKKLQSKLINSREYDATSQITGLEEAYQRNLIDGVDGFRTKLRKLKLKSKFSAEDMLKDANSEAAIRDIISNQTFDDSDLSKIAKVVDEHDRLMVKLRREKGIATDELEGRAGKQYNVPTLMLTPPRYRTLFSNFNKDAKAYMQANDLKDISDAKIQMAMNEWVEHQKNSLDLKKTFGMDELESLNKSEKELLQKKLIGGFKAITDPNYAKSIRSKDLSLANRLKKRRVYYYKDGKTAAEYSRLYGAGSLYDSIMAETNANARTLATASVFGPDPSTSWDILKKDIQKNASSIQKNKYLSAIDRDVRYLAGDLRPDSVTWGGHIVENGKKVVAMARLGKVVINSISDVANALVHLDHLGAGFTDKIEYLTRNVGTMLENLPGFKGKRFSQERKEFLESIGFMAKHMAHNRLTADIGDFSGKLDKVSQKFYTMNAQNWFDRSLKEAHAANTSRQLGKIAAKSFDNLPYETRTLFEAYGFNSKQWDLIRKDITKSDGHKFLTPDSILNLDDKEFSGSGINKKDLYRKTLGFILDGYRHVVPMGDISDRALRAERMQSSSANSIIMNSFFQFKSFLFGYTRNLNREYKLYASNPDFETMAKPRAIVKMLGNKIIPVAALSLFSYMIDKKLKGEPLGLDFNSENPKKRHDAYINMTQALLPAFGAYGTVLNSFLNPRSAQSQLSGPMINASISTMENLKSIFGEIIDPRRHKKTWQLSTAEMLYNNLPMHNLFYVDALAKSYLAKPVMDAIEPNSYEQMINKIKEE